MSESGTSPSTQEIAQRLLAYEACEHSSSEANTSAVAHVCEKLGRPLSKLIGETGSRALLARALTLAKRETAVLSSVKVTDDGALEGLDGDAEGASTVLVGHLIGLVLTFLGEALTLRLLHDVWTERTISDVHFGGRSIEFRYVRGNPKTAERELRRVAGDHKSDAALPQAIYQSGSQFLPGSAFFTVF